MDRKARKSIPPSAFRRYGLFILHPDQLRNDSETSGKADNDSGEITTERDTVVSAHVKVGPGSSRVKVLKQYHVLDIHDKYTEMLTWMTARTISRLLRDNEVKDVVGKLKRV